MMSFYVSLLIGANAMTSCAPPSSGPWYGRMPVGHQHAALCYVVKRRPHMTQIA